MSETASASKLSRLRWVSAAAVFGFVAAWLALDASQTLGHYWPIHVVSGPVFWPANLSRDDQYAVLLFIGTAVLFALYTWCVMTFRAWIVVPVIAVLHAGFAIANIAGGNG